MLGNDRARKNARSMACAVGVLTQPRAPGATVSAAMVSRVCSQADSFAWVAALSPA